MGSSPDGIRCTFCSSLYVTNIGDDFGYRLRRGDDTVLWFHFSLAVDTHPEQYIPNIDTLNPIFKHHNPKSRHSFPTRRSSDLQEVQEVSSGLDPVNDYDGVGSLTNQANPLTFRHFRKKCQDIHRNAATSRPSLQYNLVKGWVV